MTAQRQARPAFTPSPSVVLTVQAGVPQQVPTTPSPGRPVVAGSHPAPNATQPLVPSQSFQVRVGG